ncbi:MAG: aminotransferase class V-fold PLP-dependent enzyme [Marinifilaceae bacterium]|jgi:selenocysteine lyase/cysteine desulfurase|nr:aminotransferase class V-fold PLP-dependent enzyme [Marinifilaceae bacterium]
MTRLEKYFNKYKNNTIGNKAKFKGPYGWKKILYSDWMASGRFYHPIEEIISKQFASLYANTHTESNYTGCMTTKAYKKANQIIKDHVNASDKDILIHSGFGMTSAINKLQRILGLKSCGHVNKLGCHKENEKTLILISHMEHHSNQTSWYETNAEVIIVPPDENLNFDLNNLKDCLEQNKSRSRIIGSFTACSNVTGIQNPVHKIAKLMHEYNALCFIDYSSSAPYVDINMHPESEEEKLDGIFFSPHKFLGGPGSSGILIFNSILYKISAPDKPGGGTVDWTNPWGKHKYTDNIEEREDGGTPGIIQNIKTALAIKLKEQMNTAKILAREEEQVKYTFSLLDKLPQVKILANENRNRLGVFSFYIEDIHYNLVVKILSEKFGIQTRGGCACAGTYGHYLLGVDEIRSTEITNLIDTGDFSSKPGWVRFSIHPTTTNKEILYFAKSLSTLIKNIDKWKSFYLYDKRTNEFYHKKFNYYFDKQLENIIKL